MYNEIVDNDNVPLVLSSIWCSRQIVAFPQQTWRFPGFLSPPFFFLLNPEPNLSEGWPSGVLKLPDLWPHSERWRPCDENIAWRPQAESQGASWLKTTIWFGVTLSPNETSALSCYTCVWGGGRKSQSVIYEINLLVAAEPNVKICRTI